VYRNSRLPKNFSIPCFDIFVVQEKLLAHAEAFLCQEKYRFFLHIWLSNLSSAGLRNGLAANYAYTAPDRALCVLLEVRPVNRPLQIDEVEYIDTS
jgi:hypothetical protein